jgi:hypothetical protein
MCHFQEFSFESSNAKVADCFVDFVAGCLWYSVYYEACCVQAEYYL